MIEALERALAANGQQPGLPELESALATALGNPGGVVSLEAHERLKPRVFRLRFEIGDEARSVVVKRMEPQEARRNELAIRRWLPALGFGCAAPALLGAAAERTGRWVWHVYEDLGPWALEPTDPDPERVAPAVRLIASLHSRFAAHPLLAECRLHGESLGFASNIRDAVHGLESVRRARLSLDAERAGLLDRLLARLHRLLDEEPMRARAVAEWGGPETFLHGDLWATNTFVQPAAGGPRARLIDWDHAGVGPASYDLSTFLLRFAPGHRSRILALYRESLENGGWHMPGRRELNFLFETAECGRYANRAVWPALALLREGAEWGFPALAAVDDWFQALEPVLPEEPQ